MTRYQRDAQDGRPRSENDRKLSCDFKHRYASRAEAIERLRQIVARRHKSRGISRKRRRMFKNVKLRPYKCRYCGGWHHGQGT